MDNNVTRHIPDELNRDDWNTMVLHYLGVDHIGHKAGPRRYRLKGTRVIAKLTSRSPNMVPKQREMDGIVRQIYEAIETHDHLKSTLLVLCGDHGMNDAGNHGGSAPGETSPALVFVSSKLKAVATKLEVPAQFQDDFQYYATIEQSDIVPTMGSLLGFPVPRNNLGAFIPSFLPLWPNSKCIVVENIPEANGGTENDKVQILLRNARQILHIVTATFPSFETDGPSEECEESSSSIEELACQWKTIIRSVPQVDKEDRDDEPWLLAISQASFTSDSILISNLQQWLRNAQELMSNTASNYDISKLITGQILAAVSLGLSITTAGSMITSSSRTVAPLLSIAFAYGIMMFASSYVEEEQHFWYWATTAWVMLLWIKK